MSPPTPVALTFNGHTQDVYACLAIVRPGDDEASRENFAPRVLGRELSLILPVLIEPGY